MAIGSMRVVVIGGTERYLHEGLDRRDVDFSAEDARFS